MDYQLEKKQYDFLAKEFKKPLSTIYRVGVNGRRYYYEIIEGTPVIYASGTTIISDGYPDPTNAMEQWRVKMRVEGRDPDAYANYRATYGTIMHILFGDFLMGKKIPLAKLGHYIKNLKDTKISKPRIEELVNNNLDEFKKDMLAFAQFVKDYNVKPMAIEMMIRSKKYKAATAIDLVCKMDIDVIGDFGVVYKTSNKAKGYVAGDVRLTKGKKTITALVDFKSGKKGFYDKHALQLLLNKQMMLENYPEVEIEGIFNFSPKAWKGTPSYNLKDQSDNPVLNELEEVLNLGMKRHLKKNKNVKIFSGTLDMNQEFDYSKNYVVQDLHDYIVSQDKQENVLLNLIEEEKISNEQELSKFLEKQDEDYLEVLANGIGITYNSEFITNVLKKYIDAQG